MWGVAPTIGLAPLASLTSFSSLLPVPPSLPFSLSPLSSVSFSISLASVFFISLCHFYLLCYLSFLSSPLLLCFCLVPSPSLLSSPFQPQEDTVSEQAIVSQSEFTLSPALPYDSLTLVSNSRPATVSIRLCHSL